MYHSHSSVISITNTTDCNKVQACACSNGLWWVVMYPRCEGLDAGSGQSLMHWIFISGGKLFGCPVVTCLLGVFVFCSWLGSPSSRTLASLGRTPACTLQRTSGRCSWWKTKEQQFDYHFHGDDTGFWDCWDLVGKSFVCLRGRCRAGKPMHKVLVG